MSEALPPRLHGAPEPGDQPERRSRTPGGTLRRRGGIFDLPLWLRTASSLGIAAIAMVALVIYVSDHNTNSPPITNLAVEGRANREAEILVAQDQAPHVARLAAKAAPESAVKHSIAGVMATLIGRGAISGPLQSQTCASAGRRTGIVRAFSCTAQAGGVDYQFRAVVDVRARRVTYCKRDPPAIPSQNVPLSRRCLS